MNPSIRSQTIADVLRRTAQRTPNKVAIICGETEWTYSELQARAERLAAGLRAEGVRPADKVAMLARNSHGFVAVRFALARLGAVLVPINFMLKSQEVAFILKHSGARMLITDAELSATATEAAAMGTQVTSFVWIPSEQACAPTPQMLSFDTLCACDDPLPAAEHGSGDLAQIVYTSGTESSPKGAMLTHDAVLWQYVSCVVDIGIEANDLMLHALPLYHCAQLDVFLGPAIYVGCTNVITATPTPDNLIPLLQRFSITSFFAPPTVWIALLRSPLLDPSRLTSLRKGYYGASIMPVEVLRELASRLPDVQLWNLYGQTEIAPLATILHPEDQLRKAGSCGRPTLNVETRVVNEQMADVGVGEVGEIVHRSPHLMVGYFNDDERTQAAFAGDWFHSGDLGVIDAEGYITVVDRKKDMIKTGGENVASREVEEAIYTLAGVSEVAVIGLPDAKWVEAVAAVVVLKEGASVTSSEVIAHCRSQLAGFKVPKHVLFATALPKNPSGKVLKRDLRLHYSATAQG